MARRARRAHGPGGERGVGVAGSYSEVRSSRIDCHAPSSIATAPANASHAPAHSEVA